MNSRGEGETEGVDELNREIEMLRPLRDIDSLIVYAMDLAAQLLMGPKRQRIGVFGPYGPDGDKVIDDVAQMVASKGFAAITGRGYYKPNHLNNIDNIDHIVPKLMKRLYEKFFSITTLWHNLPRITARSIVNMTVFRTNLIEWEGCVDNKIPVLGFVIRDQIYRNDPLENCDYLDFKGSYSQCASPNTAFCRFQRFCPFLSEPVRLPDIVRRVQMDTIGNRLIAVARVEDLEIPLSEFLFEKEQ